jgi:hypothetical protein
MAIVPPHARTFSRRLPQVKRAGGVSHLPRGDGRPCTGRMRSLARFELLNRRREDDTAGSLVTIKLQLLDARGAPLNPSR